MTWSDLRAYVPFDWPTALVIFVFIAWLVIMSWCSVHRLRSVPKPKLYRTLVCVVCGAERHEGLVCPWCGDPGVLRADGDNDGGHDGQGRRPVA